MEFKFIKKILLFLLMMLGSFLLVSCGEKIDLTNFEFALNADRKSYYIAEYNGYDKKVIMPNKYKSKPVTEIGKNSFSYNSSIEEIVIPRNIEIINDYAFASLTNLHTVSYDKKSNLKEIGDSAFRNCEKLEDIKLPSKLETIGERAFYNTYRTWELFIPETVTRIGNDAFVIEISRLIYTQIKSKPSGWRFDWNSDEIPVLWDFDKVTKKDGVEYVISKSGYAYIKEAKETTVKNLNIPEEISNAKVTKILKSAFASNKTIESVTIPKSVSYLGEFAFANCELLSKVTFASNSELTIINESAFSLSKKLKEFNFPENVKIIDKRAFSFTNLKKVNLLDYEDLFYIGEEAFLYVDLEWIVLPLLTYIGAKAFNNPINRTTVYINSSKTIIDYFGTFSYFWDEGTRRVYYYDEWEMIGGTPRLI